MKASVINNAFLTAKNKNDVEIEKATSRNLSRISDDDVSEIHANLINIFGIKNNDESKYFDVDEFNYLITDLREKKIERDEKKNKQ